MLEQLPLAFVPVPDRSGWFRSNYGDAGELERQVITLQDAHDLRDWQLICGALDTPGIDVTPVVLQFQQEMILSDMPDSGIQVPVDLAGRIDRYIASQHREPDGYAIYAVEDISASELARAFRTGTHNAGTTADEETEIERVCEQLKRVQQVALFRPYFVDSAGYKCRFCSQITAEQAREIEEMLEAGWEGYASEWTAESSETWPILLRENELRLWWD